MFFKKKINRDEQILECIMSILYHDGVFANANIDSIMNAGGMPLLDDKEMLKYLRGLKAEGLIKSLSAQNSFSQPVFLRNAHIALSPEGEKIMLKYGSYIKYKKKEDGKEFKKSIDRNIRNGNIIVSIILLSLSLILTQFPTRNNKQQQKIEQDIQSLSKKLDSLSQVLRTQSKIK